MRDKAWARKDPLELGEGGADPRPDHGRVFNVLAGEGKPRSDSNLGWSTGWSGGGDEAADLWGGHE